MNKLYFYFVIDLNMWAFCLSHSLFWCISCVLVEISFSLSIYFPHLNKINIKYSFFCFCCSIGKSPNTQIAGISSAIVIIFVIACIGQ